MRFPRTRRLFVLSRALVRTALSGHTGVATHAWRFRRTPEGRPEIDAPATEAVLRFNLAHTGGLAACVVGRGGELGVDAEDWQRPLRHEAVAERCLSAGERAALTALAPGHRRRRLLEHWTVKEAYLKARGLGLALPLKQIEVDFGGAAPRLALGPRIGDDPGRWQVAVVHPGPRHVVAVCVSRAAGGVPGLVVVEVDPQSA